MQNYHGSCHCGVVRLTIQADLSQLTRCTCSICSKEGLLGCYVLRERFQLLAGRGRIDPLSIQQEDRQTLLLQTLRHPCFSQSSLEPRCVCRKRTLS